MTLNSDAVAAVKLGAEFLNKSTAAPSDWASKIDKDRLRLSSSYDCVLGQLFGGYGTGLRKLGLTDSQAERLGFISQVNYPYVTSAQLNEAWKDYLSNTVTKGQIYTNAYGDAYRIEEIVTRESDGKQVAIVTSGMMSDDKFTHSDNSMYVLQVSRFRSGGSYKLYTKPAYKNGDVLVGKSPAGEKVTLIVNNLGGQHEMLCFSGDSFVTHCPISYFEKNYGPLRRATFQGDNANVRSGMKV